MTGAGGMAAREPAGAADSPGWEPSLQFMFFEIKTEEEKKKNNPSPLPLPFFEAPPGLAGAGALLAAVAARALSIGAFESRSGEFLAFPQYQPRVAHT